MLYIDNTTSSNKTWVYVFVRNNLPIEQVLVQSAHAALESGIFYALTHGRFSQLIKLGAD